MQWNGINNSEGGVVDCSKHDMPMLLRVSPGMGAVDEQGTETQEREYCPLCETEALQAENARLKERVKELEAWKAQAEGLLKKLEWREVYERPFGTAEMAYMLKCPCCGGYKHKSGHADSCELAAFLHPEQAGEKKT